MPLAPRRLVLCLSGLLPLVGCGDGPHHPRAGSYPADAEAGDSGDGDLDPLEPDASSDLDASMADAAQHDASSATDGGDDAGEDGLDAGADASTDAGGGLDDGGQHDASADSGAASEHCECVWGQGAYCKRSLGSDVGTIVWAGEVEPGVRGFIHWKLTGGYQHLYQMSFLDGQPSRTLFTTSSSVSFGDIDNDGDIDATEPFAYAYFNVDESDPWTKVEFSRDIGSGFTWFCNHLTAVDADGDGDLDIACMGNTGMWQENIGGDPDTWTWEELGFVDFSAYGAIPAVADFDLDGRQEIWMATMERGGFVWDFASGSWADTRVDPYVAFETTEYGEEKVTVVRMPGDDYPDVVRYRRTWRRDEPDAYYNPLVNETVLVEQTAEGTWAIRKDIPLLAPDAADRDNDRKLDRLIAGGWATLATSAAGKPVYHVLDANCSEHPLAVFDLAGDGAIGWQPAAACAAPGDYWQRDPSKQCAFDDPCAAGKNPCTNSQVCVQIPDGHARCDAKAPL